MAIVQQICPLCNKPNECGINASVSCWCMETEFPSELLNKVPAELKNVACVCQYCVSDFNASKQCQ